MSNDENDFGQWRNPVFLEEEIKPKKLLISMK